MSSLFKWLTKQRIPASKMDVRDAKRELRFLILYSLFYVALAIPISYLILWFPLPILGASNLTHQVWYALGFKIIALLIIPYWVFHSWGYRFRELVVLDWRFSPSSLFGIFLAVGFGFFLNLGHIPKIVEAIPNFSGLDLGLRLGIAVVLPIFAAAIPEELFYRRMLQTQIELRSSRLCAILVTAILFTAWHLPTRFFLSDGVEGEAGNLVSVMLGTGIPVFIIGLIFSWHWDRYRRIVPLIVCHWAIDFLPFLSSFLKIKF